MQQKLKYGLSYKTWGVTEATENYSKNIACPSIRKDFKTWQAIFSDQEVPS